jgi:hypothetical protein
LIARVIAERARGLRTVIPGGEPLRPPPVRRAVLLAAAAALIIGILTIDWWSTGDHRATEDSWQGACGMNAETRTLLASSFLLAAACAQEPAGLPYEPAPPVMALDGRPPRAGTWTYEIGRRDDNNRRRDVYELDRIGSADQIAWRSVSTAGTVDAPAFSDTLFYAADGLRPVRGVMHRPKDGKDLWVVEVNYGPSSVGVVSDYLGYRGNPPQRRTWTSGLPLGAAPILPAVHGPGIVHLLRNLPLAAGWAGSVQSGPFGTTGFRTASLRVVGEESVQVPAGIYECWRVALTSESSGLQTLWVSKAERLLVKSLSGSDEQGVEAVLVSFAPRE